MRLADTPAYLNLPGEDGHVRYGEGLHVGYRYYDAVDPQGQLPLRPRPVLHLLRALAEWLDHPTGHDLLLDLLRRSPRGDLTPLLDDPEQLRMLGSFPLSRLAPMVSLEANEGLLAVVSPARER